MTDSDIGDRAAKAVDIASTLHQVMIGLSSGIIAAVLGIYPNLLTITNLNFFWLQISLIFFAISIFGGLIALGGLVTVTATPISTEQKEQQKDPIITEQKKGKKRKEKKQKDPVPTNNREVRIPGTAQLVSFGVGMVFLLFLIWL